MTYTHYQRIDIEQSGAIDYIEGVGWQRLDASDSNGLSMRVISVDPDKVMGRGDARAIGKVDMFDENGQRAGEYGFAALLK